MGSSPRIDIEKGDKLMEFHDYYDRIPEYYPTMYMDGYTPTEILYATHKMMNR